MFAISSKYATKRCERTLTFIKITSTQPKLIQNVLGTIVQTVQISKFFLVYICIWHSRVFHLKNWKVNCNASGVNMYGLLWFVHTYSMYLLPFCQLFVLHPLVQVRNYRYLLLTLLKFFNNNYCLITKIVFFFCLISL